MLAVATEYWKPGVKYLNIILASLEKRIDDGDFVVISEKALSTALGNIADESSIRPSLNAKFVSRIWMRIVWGYILGPLCRIGQRLRLRLQRYPYEVGSKHKQFALQQVGLLQALMWGSEGGIDGSNLPYSIVSLPLSKPYELAEEIHQKILHKLNKKVYVVIVDTDKTYSLRNFHFTPRTKPMKGIQSLGGVITYIIGRFLKFKKRPTPLGIAGDGLQAKEALEIANVAERIRGSGSGSTVWDMASKFNVAVTEISWNMLSNIKHKPIVIVRKRRESYF
jgi:F420-0:gamma-glutamyl ligase-like protein